MAKSRTRVELEGGNEAFIRLHIEAVDPRVYVAMSPDVQGLVAEGRSVMEAVEIAQGLARKIVESCIQHGNPLPRAFSNPKPKSLDLLVPVAIR